MDRLLGVNAQQKVTLLARIVRRRYDAVVAGNQLVTTGDLSHVDELRTPGHRLVSSEEVLLQQTAVRTVHLRASRRKAIDNEKKPALTRV